MAFRRQEIDKTLNSKSPNAIFLYDTTTDSDGGAWTTKFPHTSWARDTGKPFPKLAYIEITGANDGEIYIYDATDGNFEQYLYLRKHIFFGSNPTCVTAKNGIIFIGDSASDNNHGLAAYDFPRDMHVSYDYSRNIPWLDAGPITNITTDGSIVRYGATKHPLFRTMPVFEDSPIYHIDSTVHPDAPVSPDTGLPLPTIAWAHSGSAGNGVQILSPFWQSRATGGGQQQWLLGDYEPRYAGIGWTNSAYYFTDVTFAANGRDLMVGIEYEPGQNYDRRYMYLDNYEQYLTNSGHAISVNEFRRSTTVFVTNNNRWSGGDPRKGAIHDHKDGTLAVSGGSDGLGIVKWGGSVGDSLSAIMMPSNTIYGGTRATHAYNTGWLMSDCVYAMADSSVGNALSRYSSSDNELNGSYDGYGAVSLLSLVNVTGSGTGPYVFAQAADIPRATWDDLRPFQNYILEFNVTATTGSPTTIQFDDDAAGLGGPNKVYKFASIGVGSYKIMFKTTRSNRLRLLNNATSNGGFTIDNLNLREAPTDRSNNEERQGSWSDAVAVDYYGTLTPYTVESGSNLRAFQCTSSSGIRLPYHSSRQLGTTYTVMWWAKYIDNSTWDLIFSLSSVSSSNHGAGIGFRNSGNNGQLSVYNYLVNQGLTFNPPGYEGTAGKVTGQWDFYCVTCDGVNGTRLYVNGNEASRSATVNVNLNLPAVSDAHYYIGAEGPTTYNSGIIDGRTKYLAQFRLFKKYTTPETARWIFNSELPMFAEDSDVIVDYGASSTNGGMDYDPHSRTLAIAAGGSGYNLIRGLNVIEKDDSGLSASKVAYSKHTVVRRT